MSITAIAYAAYFCITTAATVLAAEGLRRKALSGPMPGFYLVCIGFTVLVAPTRYSLNTPATAIEAVLRCSGAVLVIIGLAYCVGMWLCARPGRRRPQTTGWEANTPIGRVLD